MTFNNNLRTNEPAFISNEKYAKTKRPQGLHKSLTDCCYSLANLALIVSCVIALVFVVKFFFDSILYDNAEHLLGLRFYRQLIFIGVALGLVLLIPLFNTVNACFCTSSGERTSTVLGALLMIVFMFVGLALIASSIRQTSVENQLKPELRKHMQFRYANDFSYVLLDEIQEEYECCDVIWYRDHYFDKLPISCYVSDSIYAITKTRNCDEVLGTLVSRRCMIIACCLVAILVSLAILSGLDALDCMLNSSAQNKYNVEARESKQLASGSSGLMSRGSQVGNAGNSDDDDDDDEDDADDDSGQSAHRASPSNQHEQEPLDSGSADARTLERLGNQQQVISDILAGQSDDRRSRRPLLTKMGASSLEQQQQQQKQRLPALNSDPYNSSTPVYQPTTEPILLTRAHYAPGPSRAQSPLFLSNRPGGGGGGLRDLQAGNSRSLLGQTSGSSLKKSNSILRIDDDDDSDLQTDSDADQNSSTIEQLKKGSQHYQHSKMMSTLDRDTQTRRSLLSVRFAD